MEFTTAFKEIARLGRIQKDVLKKLATGWKIVKHESHLYGCKITYALVDAHDADQLHISEKVVDSLWLRALLQEECVYTTVQPDTWTWHYTINPQHLHLIQANIQ